MSDHGMNCPHHADKDEACTCALTERTMHAAWRKRAEEAETRIAALESQVKALTEERDAQAEAVRVLGTEVYTFRKRYIEQSLADAGSAAHILFYATLAKELKQAMLNTTANPIARAAVEGGSK